MGRRSAPGAKAAKDFGLTNGDETLNYFYKRSTNRPREQQCKTSRIFILTPLPFTRSGERKCLKSSRQEDSALQSCTQPQRRISLPPQEPTWQLERFASD